jgi:xanthine dehydrogenase YagR molybdenum-binding subunit
MPETHPREASPILRFGSNAGQPLTRRDGVLKVTGRATYAADNHPGGMLYAVCAVSTIARGRVAHLDVETAKAHLRVVEVITPANRPPLAGDPEGKHGLFAFRLEALQNDRVRYAGQPIALVVAETLEAATEGAALLRPRYEAEDPRLGLHVERHVPETVGVGSPAGGAHGDAEAALSVATLRIDATYETPSQYHNAMEPHAIVASWDGDRLTLDTPNQAPHLARAAYAGFFGVPPENVLIRTPFIGGGFGSKAILAGAHVLTVLAARMTRRPVKLALTRAQMFGPVGHRGETRQRIRLGVETDGRLAAIAHHTIAATSSFDDFIEPSGGVSRMLYASPAIAISHEAVRNDIGTPGPMRAPGLASGSAALEVAIDEAADACGMDPLDFRLANYAEVEPITGKSWSSKALRECYAQGATAFSWSGRPRAPRQMRDDDGFLVGWGMGTAVFHCPMFAAEARVLVHRDDKATVATSAIDMGQGALTALAQIAADSLGLDIEQVTLRFGRSDLPDGGVAGGSGHTATAGSAIDAAGRNAIARLADLATADRGSPLFGAGNVGVVARGGRLVRKDDESRSESFAAILARAGRTEIDGEGKGARDPAAAGDHALQAHGAVFAEVKVDPDLGQIRVTRLVGAFAAGRIINPRLVQSQLHGGMIWGVSFALHEGASVDRRTGRVMNADLGEYHVPVNADVPSIETLLVPEDDQFVNGLGVKGVGEIGITGTVGAVANALWHATGVRVRRFPVRIEDMVATAPVAWKHEAGPL